MLRGAHGGYTGLHVLCRKGTETAGHRDVVWVLREACAGVRLGKEGTGRRRSLQRIRKRLYDVAGGLLEQESRVRHLVLTGTNQTTR
jgi:hypothetical protein